MISPSNLDCTLHYLREFIAILGKPCIIEALMPDLSWTQQADFQQATQIFHQIQQMVSVRWCIELSCDYRRVYNNMQPNLQQTKKSLFSHADPGLAIRQMKSMNNHLHKTRDLLHQSLDLMANIKVGVANTSNHLEGTSSMYDNYSEELKKSDIFVKCLKRKEQENARKIKFAFWFLVASVIFIILRRILFPSFYRSMFKFL